MRRRISKLESRVGTPSKEAIRLALRHYADHGVLPPDVDPKVGELVLSIAKARLEMLASVPDRPGHWGDDGIYMPDDEPGDDVTAR
jgi:hypothetical protein